MDTGNLVLTRREGEAILIGDDIRVHVVRIKRDQIQLMISAPREVRIVREELVGRE